MITKLIQKGKLVFPDPIRHRIKMSSDMKDFISGLLEKDPTKRLGYKGKKEVLEHPWFDNVKWDSIMKRKIKPPYYPETS
jgi:serum/glucocorticoid-regulated kinase 2